MFPPRASWPNLTSALMLEKSTPFSSFRKRFPPGGQIAAKEQAKAAFKERFGSAWSKSASAPVRLRPSPRRTAHYSRVDEAEARIAASSFDPELFVLAKQEGPVLGLESTAALTAALRGYLLQGGEGKQEWFTGDSAPGVPSTGGHMALLPLAYVSSEHADGHILGLAVAFPRGIPAKERAECLRGRLFAPSGEDIEPELKMGNLGTWTVRREERSLPPLALLVGDVVRAVVRLGECHAHRSRPPSKGRSAH